jgi:hypothetical protein
VLARANQRAQQRLGYRAAAISSASAATAPAKQQQQQQQQLHVTLSKVSRRRGSAAAAAPAAAAGDPAADASWSATLKRALNEFALVEHDSTRASRQRKVQGALPVVYDKSEVLFAAATSRSIGCLGAAERSQFVQLERGIDATLRNERHAWNTADMRALKRTVKKLTLQQQSVFVQRARRRNSNSNSAARRLSSDVAAAHAAHAAASSKHKQQQTKHAHTVSAALARGESLVTQLHAPGQYKRIAVRRQQQQQQQPNGANAYRRRHISSGSSSGSSSGNRQRQWSGLQRRQRARLELPWQRKKAPVPRAPALLSTAAAPSAASAAAAARHGGKQLQHRFRVSGHKQQQQQQHAPHHHRRATFILPVAVAIDQRSCEQ